MYNGEHYSDPTAGAAIGRADRERRIQKMLLQEIRNRQGKRMTQKEFYKSKAWRLARSGYISYRMALDGGLCEVCRAEPGKIVHHYRIWLNDDNCNEPKISLAWSNFRYECQTCHNQEKDPARIIPGRVKYGPNGEVLKNDQKQTPPI